MVISFEEKDREAIEATGMTVMQFKQIVYKAVDWTKEYFEAVMEALRKITEFFTDALKEFQENITDVFEDVRNWYFNLPEPERHKIVKWYIKANTPAMIARKDSVYHCRNNC